MIRLRFIPDGNDRVPQEATDHGLLATHLKNDGDPVLSVDNNENTASSWRDVRRIIPGHRKFISITVPGNLADYSQTTLDAFQNAIVDNVNGLKAHPDGWTEVGQPR